MLILLNKHFLKYFYEDRTTQLLLIAFCCFKELQDPLD